jgi:type 1 glutamine amidotransferase
VALALTLIAGCQQTRRRSEPPADVQMDVAGASGNYRVLVFTRTLGWRHDSIPDAIAAIRRVGTREGFAADATEDPFAFAPAQLGRYRVVMFVLTTGDVLDDRQQQALEGFVQSGRGFVGVHSACDTEYDWPWYVKLVGTSFKSHPWIQQAKVRIRDANHPATALLPTTWDRTDEWYNFRVFPRGVKVLADVDERTYLGGDHGADHPVSWYHAYDGGRSFFTAMGHTRDSYHEAPFLDHLRGAIGYAAGM